MWDSALLHLSAKQLQTSRKCGAMWRQILVRLLDCSLRCITSSSSAECIHLIPTCPPIKQIRIWRLKLCIYLSQSASLFLGVGGYSTTEGPAVSAFVTRQGSWWSLWLRVFDRVLCEPLPKSNRLQKPDKGAGWISRRERFISADLSTVTEKVKSLFFWMKPYLGYS